MTTSGSTSSLRRLEMEVQGGTLVIGDRNPWHICLFCWARHSDIIITMPELEKVEASGANRFNIAGFDGSALGIKLSGASRGEITGSYPSLQTDMSGASRLMLMGQAQIIEAELSGASRLEATAAYIGTANVELSGASRASLGTVQTLIVKASGASRVTYTNDPFIAEQKLSGSSSVEKVEREDNEDRDIPFVTPVPPLPPAAPILPIPPRTGTGGTR